MDLADEESESGIEKEMTLLTIECQYCQHTKKISDNNFDLRVRFKNQFVCFVEIGSEFNEERINEISKHPDTSFEILYGRFKWYAYNIGIP